MGRSPGKRKCGRFDHYFLCLLNAFCDASFDDKTTELFLLNGEVAGSEGSRDVIADVLSHHVTRIEKILKEWDTGRMNFIFIGGTAKLLQKILEEKYKDRAFIPEDCEFVNCRGFLKSLITSQGYSCPF